MKTRILFALLSVMVLLACSSVTDLFSSSESIEETPTVVVEPSVTDVANVTPAQPCPVSSGASQLDPSTSFPEMPADIQSYLNDGGDLENLVTSLEELEMVIDASQPLIQADLTGDGFLDVILLLLDPEPEFMMPSGTFILYQCQNEGYVLSYQSPISEDVSVPFVHSTMDLNSDGLNDLLVGHQSCGAHTCFERLEILSWDGAILKNTMGGSSADIPNPIIEAFPDENKVLATAQGIGSAGAGPFRRFTRGWIWNPDTESFLPTEDEFLPSLFRLHLLHDADQAVAQRDYNLALELYSQVIEDDGLQDWADPATEREILAAYASFRRMHTQILIADLDSAETAYNDLRTEYPPGSLGHEFAQMGEAFWSDYEANGDVISACVTAQAFAMSHQESIIDILYFGYANPVYTSEEICPSSN